MISVKSSTVLKAESSCKFMLEYDNKNFCRQSMKTLKPLFSVKLNTHRLSDVQLGLILTVRCLCQI